MISTTQDSTTTALLVKALGTAVLDTCATAGIVYFPTADGAFLRAAALGGSPPEVFVLMEAMPTSAPFASATAWRTGRICVIGEPAGDGVTDVGLHRLMLPHPFSVAAVPVTDPAGARLGTLAVVRIPDRDGPLTPGRYDSLRAVAAALGRALGGGRPPRPPHRPVVFPIFDDDRAVDGGWNFPAVPGTGGLSMMYIIHKLYPALSGARTTAEVADTVRERIMEPLGAESLILTLVHDARLWVVGHTSAPPGAVRDLHGSPADGGSPAAHVLTGQPLFTSADDLVRACPGTPLAAQPSWAVLPLTAQNRAVGSLLLGWSSPRRISPEEQGLMGMLGSLLGPALDSAHRAEAEHALAESVQTRLLPVLPDLPDVVTTGRYLPAPASEGVGVTAGTGVGGDWYDVLPLPGGRIALVAGDVEGHGLQAAAVMGQLRSAVRAYAVEGHGPAAVLARAGAALAEETTLLATCAVCRLDPADGTLETALAGHPPPLIRVPDSPVRPVRAVPGLPLGVLAPGHDYQAYESVIPPGTLVALYTDGMCTSPRVDLVATACDILSGVGDFADLEGAADRFVAAVGPERHDDGALLLARYDAARGTPNRRTARTAVHRHDLRGVRMVRRTIEDTLAAWQMSDLVDEAVLVASELVTNALLHADSAVDVRLREYPDRIRVEVRDTAATPPIPSALALTDAARAESESGRGLIIVESVAAAWGNSPSGRGKTVWFELGTGER